MLKIPITGKPLKPCPFCGSTKVSMYEITHFYVIFPDEYEYMIECSNCEATMKRDTKTLVKRAWNRRKLESKAFVDGYKEGLKI